MFKSAIGTFPWELITLCDFFGALPAPVSGRAVPTARLLAGTGACPVPPSGTVGAKWGEGFEDSAPERCHALHNFDGLGDFLPFISDNEPLCHSTVKLNAFSVYNLFIVFGDLTGVNFPRDIEHNEVSAVSSAISSAHFEDFSCRSGRGYTFKNFFILTAYVDVIST